MEVHLGQEVALQLKTFRRHMVCLGSSGSGKTVACKVVCEEFIRHGIPVIAIDPQGDIASLALCEEPKITMSKGISRGAIKEYERNAEVVVWTPASSIGVPLSLNPIGVVKESLKQEQGYEDTLRAISLASDSITALLDYELSSDEGRLMAGILNIALTFIHENALDIDDFSGLADFLSAPADEFLQRVQPIASRNNLAVLAKKLRLLTVGVKSLLFELGKPLDIEELLGLKNGGTKTRLSVIYLNTLSSQEEKEFFVARIAHALYQWSLANPSDDLQALFYIDEVAPFIPPVRKPACKDILKLLFKQARKYGVGCLIASQNPADIDYTAVSQCSTWNLGRLLTRQDIKKVEKMLKSLSPVHFADVVHRLPSLTPGRFLLFAPDEFQEVVEFQVRWLITQHKTLDEEQIRALVPDRLRRRYLNDEHSQQNKKQEAVVERQEQAEVEKETAQIDENLPPEQKILQLLEHERACLSINDIAERLGFNPATVRKHIGNAGEKIIREKHGKGYLYWHANYSFLPRYGLTHCIDVARLQVLEREAIRLAEKRLSKQLIFFDSETIDGVDLSYLPLWQVHFTEQLEKSFLFFKSTTYKRENIYFHALAGTICTYDRSGGFCFVDTPKDNPSALVDLDDVCLFDSTVPGELDVDWRFLQKALPSRELQKLITRKFQIEVHAINLTFLPIWRFKLVDKNSQKSRDLSLDGVTGMPIAES